MPSRTELQDRNREIIERVVSPPEASVSDVARDHDITPTRVLQILAEYGFDGETRAGLNYEEPVAYAPQHPRADDHGLVPRRILVAEENLGRPLYEGEVVLVREDGAGLDPDNLEVVTRAEKARRILEEKKNKQGGVEPLDLLTALRWLALEMDRTPRAYDINEHLPLTHIPYFRTFGSLTAAQEAAGLEPNHRGGVPEVPDLPPGFRDEWAWLAGYETPGEAIEAARERAAREQDEEDG